MVVANMPASTRGSRGAAPKAKATKVKAIAKTKAKPAAKKPAAKKPAAKPRRQRRCARANWKECTPIVRR